MAGCPEGNLPMASISNLIPDYNNPDIDIRICLI